MTIDEPQSPQAPVTPATVAAQAQRREAAKIDPPVEDERRDDVASTRVRELESLLEIERVENLRNRVAQDYGINAEDRAVLLSGTDEETLIAQARRLREKTPSAGLNRARWKEPRRASTSETRFSFGPGW